MLMARREGVICLYPAVLGVLSQTVCRAPGITRQGKASLASFGGGLGGEELKGNVGLTFLISRLRPPLPTSQPRGCLLFISRLSALTGPLPCLQLRRAGGCRAPPAAGRWRQQSARASPPAPTCASEGGSAAETGVVLSASQVRVSSAFALGCHCWRGRSFAG